MYDIRGLSNKQYTIPLITLINHIKFFNYNNEFTLNVLDKFVDRNVNLNMNPIPPIHSGIFGNEDDDRGESKGNNSLLAQAELAVEQIDIIEYLSKFRILSNKSLSKQLIDRFIKMGANMSSYHPDAMKAVQILLKFGFDKSLLKIICKDEKDSGRLVEQFGKLCELDVINYNDIRNKIENRQLEPDDLSADIYKEILLIQDDQQRSLLFLAIGHNNSYESICKLIDIGDKESIALKDKKGKTILSFLLAANNKPLIRYIIKNYGSRFDKKKFSDLAKKMHDGHRINHNNHSQLRIAANNGDYFKVVYLLTDHHWTSIEIQDAIKMAKEYPGITAQLIRAYNKLLPTQNK